ncbi:hypothetical protein TNCV_4188981 [Trichonephila clavipes]|nr:hypothetical protein TNCV_4188981 [Trichonephila clavipes]
MRVSLFNKSSKLKTATEKAILSFSDCEAHFEGSTPAPALIDVSLTYTNANLASKMGSLITRISLFKPYSTARRLIALAESSQHCSFRRSDCDSLRRPINKPGILDYP